MKLLLGSGSDVRASLAEIGFGGMLHHGNVRLITDSCKASNL